MARFGCVAVDKKYATDKQVVDAFSIQIQQEIDDRTHDPQLLGEIMLANKWLTKPQYNDIIGNVMMEPSINWVHDTEFSESLKRHKRAKQALGEYLGKMFAQRQYNGNGIVIGGGSTMYYCFLGLMKHHAQVNVYTMNAAILSAYTSVQSAVRKVTTVWQGEVDVGNAIVVPPLDDEHGMRLIDRYCSFVVLPARSFDPNRGPQFGVDAAKILARIAGKCNVSILFMIDHTKASVTNDTPATQFVYRKDEWDKMVQDKRVNVISTRHPKLPNNVPIPKLRELDKIRETLIQQNLSKTEIKEVEEYVKWTRRLGTHGLLIEVPM